MYGVPQGSSLGPLLFLLFVNDFPNVIEESSVFMYADDIVIASSGQTAHESADRLDRDVNRTSAWCASNCLNVNYKKTRVMRVNRNNVKNLPPLLIKVGDIQLQEVIEYKYLGAVVDCKLTFKPHVNSLIKLMSHKLYLLARIRQYIYIYMNKLETIVI